eukprot:12348972-Alexandrium_andersonii.AAC.1
MPKRGERGNTKPRTLRHMNIAKLKPRAPTANRRKAWRRRTLPTLEPRASWSRLSSRRPQGAMPCCTRAPPPLSSAQGR